MTDTVTVAVLFPAAAVMLVVPVDKPLTNPCEFTAASMGREDVQITGAPVTISPASSRLILRMKRRCV